MARARGRNGRMLALQFRLIYSTPLFSVLLSLSSASAARPARPVPEAVYGLIMAVLGEERVVGRSGKPFQRVIIAISLAPCFLLVQGDGKKDKERKTDTEDGWKEGGHKPEREDKDRGDYYSLFVFVGGLFCQERPELFFIS